MTNKRTLRLVWIIGGLSLSFLVWGGLGTVKAAALSLSTPLPLFAPGARLEPGTSTSRLLDVDVTQTPTPEERTYVVEPGDSLWSIAIKFYGNGAKYPLIQRANGLPDNTRLQTGQVLVIPFPESDKTPTPQTPTRVSPTPSPAPTLLPPMPSVSPVVSSIQPTVIAPPMDTPNPTAASSTSEVASVVPILGVVVNMLGVIFLLGGVLCALLSYDIYRRSRHYARRRYIGSRVRSGL